jgi:predicted sugar kinase
LLVERGKLPGELLSPLAERLELPAEWRFVVCWPHGERGLSGEAERAAFRALPPIPAATTARLEAEVFDALLPAARAGQFEQFSESLWRFGHEAGMCFAAEQGGAFARPSITQLVEWLRAEGVRGVGQSSWGPAVFALCQSAAGGEQLANTLRNRLARDHEVLVARPNQGGARVTRRELP